MLYDIEGMRDGQRRCIPRGAVSYPAPLALMMIYAVPEIQVALVIQALAVNSSIRTLDLSWNSFW